MRLVDEARLVRLPSRCMLRVALSLGYYEHDSGSEQFLLVRRATFVCLIQVRLRAHFSHQDVRRQDAYPSGAILRYRRKRAAHFGTHFLLFRCRVHESNGLLVFIFGT